MTEIVAGVWFIRKIAVRRDTRRLHNILESPVDRTLFGLYEQCSARWARKQSYTIDNAIVTRLLW